MKICLIRCPSPFLIEDKMFPPLGLMAVGTALKKQHHDVTIYDWQIVDVPLDFPYYGLGPTTPEYADAIDVKDKIRKYNPAAKIVIGGPFATLNPDKCLRDEFDSVVVGDGEMAAESAFRNGYSKIIANELPLDEYPIIDRSLVNIKDYKYYLEGKLATTLVTSRGCPYHCAFCCKNYTAVRLRSAENVIEEVKYLHDKYGYKALMFSEDIFILNKHRAEAIFRYMKKLGIISRCLVRADIVVKHGREFAQMMADCGCIAVGMGIESGSNTILNTIAKGETIETIKTAIRMLQDVGIKVKGFFILGLPGENRWTIAETRAFLDETHLDDIDVKIYQPYPASPIWDNQQVYDVQWQDDADYRHLFYKGRPGEYFGNIHTSALSSADLVKEWTDMEATYKHA